MAPIYHYLIIAVGYILKLLQFRAINLIISFLEMGVIVSYTIKVISNSRLSHRHHPHVKSEVTHIFACENGKRAELSHGCFQGVNYSSTRINHIQVIDLFMM